MSSTSSSTSSAVPDQWLSPSDLPPLPTHQRAPVFSLHENTPYSDLPEHPDRRLYSSQLTWRDLNPHWHSPHAHTIQPRSTSPPILSLPCRPPASPPSFFLAQRASPIDDNTAFFTMSNVNEETHNETLPRSQLYPDMFASPSPLPSTAALSRSPTFTFSPPLETCALATPSLAFLLSPAARSHALAPSPGISPIEHAPPHRPRFIRSPSHLRIHTYSPTHSSRRRPTLNPGSPAPRGLSLISSGTSGDSYASDIDIEASDAYAFDFSSPTRVQGTPFMDRLLHARRASPSIFTSSSPAPPTSSLPRVSSIMTTPEPVSPIRLSRASGSASTPATRTSSKLPCISNHSSPLSALSSSDSNFFSTSDAASDVSSSDMNSDSDSGLPLIKRARARAVVPKPTPNPIHGRLRSGRMRNVHDKENQPPQMAATAPRKRRSTTVAYSTRSKKPRLATPTPSAAFAPSSALATPLASPSSNHNANSIFSPLPPSPLSPCPAPHPGSGSQNESRYPRRTFPSHIPLDPTFLLFYRRFPLPSALEIGSRVPTLQRHPGATYNAPRTSCDLYTPRFVRGRGRDKVGVCPVCVEPVARGGEGRVAWLSMKFSAFKCYHMQYYHGISPTTGLPFSPPTAFRTHVRPNPGKHERATLREARCHQCRQWVAVEGVKDVEPKVKEIYWHSHPFSPWFLRQYANACVRPTPVNSNMNAPLDAQSQNQLHALRFDMMRMHPQRWKHAAACHHGSTIDGESDVFVHDDVYARLADETMRS